jgi:ribosomal protein L11 methyltransferase
MGFGSGHHATTRLCLDVLQTLCVAGARVVDIGTGSGVLAIAAAKLGAASVVGIDNDADALETARAGADANGPLAGLTFQQGDFRVSHLGPADIVLANLTGGMLLASVDALVRTVAPSGHLVLSGITAAEAEAVRNAYASVMDVVWDREQDEWVGLVLQAWGSLASVR